MDSNSLRVDPRLVEIIDCLYRISAKAVIIENNKMLFTLEHKDDWWSLPGGGVDYGETAHEALARELSEELGLEKDGIKVEERPLFVTTHAVVDGIPRAILYYTATINKGSISGTKNVKAYDWYSSEEMNDLKVSPSIAKILEDLKSLL